jgi:DNA-binding XRE family transcriptional regulator
MADLKYDPVAHDQKAFLEKASKRRGFREAFDALEPEYALAHEMLSARTRAGLTQEAVAEHMGTTKSAVSRLEGGGKHVPSVASLKKYADAVGCMLKIEFIPTKRRAAFPPAKRDAVSPPKRPVAAKRRPQM